MRLAVAYQYRYMLSDSWNGAAIDATLGRERPGFGLAARLGLELGKSSAGISYQVISLGGAFEWHLGKRVRLGYSPVFGVVILNRITERDNDQATVVLGTHIDLSVDVFKGKSGAAMLLLGRIGYEYLFADRDTNVFAARLGIGVRF